MKSTRDKFTGSRHHQKIEDQMYERISHIST